MKDILETIVSRRSVKSYIDKPVDDELVNKVIKAGMYAPSGKNKQSAIIIAISNKEILAQMAKAIADIRGVSGNPLYNAPVALVVLADKSVFTHVYDGSVVIENMLLEAHSLGLGACWIHHAKEVFETDFGKDLLAKVGVVGDYEGVGTCILGYPNAIPVGEISRKDNFVYYLK
ncbi:MAG: diguanylate cyclase [Clostridiales bacterium]|nr:diguanylate cyclase [Clostridiales bacterium]